MPSVGSWPNPVGHVSSIGCSLRPINRHTNPFSAHRSLLRTALSNSSSRPKNWRPLGRQLHFHSTLLNGNGPSRPPRSSLLQNLHTPFPSPLPCRFGAFRSESFLRPRDATSLESLPNWARIWFLTLLTRSWRSFSRRTASSRAAAWLLAVWSSRSPAAATRVWSSVRAARESAGCWGHSLRWP